MDYSSNHWVNSMAWSRGVGPVRNGGVKWVNTMSVVDDEAWVGNDG